MIFLRNVHPRKTVLVPLGAGWARVLRPAVTAELPERVLRTEAVRALLLRRMVAIADGGSWNADARQARASRTDMARAIALAEQAEFDRLRGGLAPQPDHHRSPERVEQLRQGVAAGATLEQLAAQHGLPRPTVIRLCRLHGLVPARPPRKPYKQRVDMWTAAAIEGLRQRWSEGASGPKIARELGGSVSAAAVVAKAARLGLPARHRPRSRAVRSKQGGEC